MQEWLLPHPGGVQGPQQTACHSCSTAVPGTRQMVTAVPIVSTEDNGGTGTSKNETRSGPGKQCQR